MARHTIRYTKNPGVHLWDKRYCAEGGHEDRPIWGAMAAGGSYWHTCYFCGRIVCSQHSTSDSTQNDSGYSQYYCNSHDRQCDCSECAGRRAPRAAAATTTAHRPTTRADTDALDILIRQAIASLRDAPGRTHMPAATTAQVGAYGAAAAQTDVSRAEPAEIATACRMLTVSGPLKHWDSWSAQDQGYVANAIRTIGRPGVEYTAQGEGLAGRAGLSEQTPIQYLERHLGANFADFLGRIVR